MNLPEEAINYGEGEQDFGFSCFPVGFWMQKIFQYMAKMIYCIRKKDRLIKHMPKQNLRDTWSHKKTRIST